MALVRGSPVSGLVALNPTEVFGGWNFKKVTEGSRVVSQSSGHSLGRYVSGLVRPSPPLALSFPSLTLCAGETVFEVHQRPARSRFKADQHSEQAAH